ncbi:MAG: hypothetical protein OES38_09765, partial [Gammaproteobacteria bacterium]|nr:hypothetical protein [Gammaproteobacteria bacterium]
ETLHGDGEFACANGGGGVFSSAPNDSIAFTVRTGDGSDPNSELAGSDGLQINIEPSLDAATVSLALQATTNTCSTAPGCHGNFGALDIDSVRADSSMFNASNPGLSTILSAGNVMTVFNLPSHTGGGFDTGALVRQWAFECAP